MSNECIKMGILKTSAFFLFLFFASFVQGQKKKEAAPVFQGVDRTLQYTPDSLGNRIPDFSYCGYKAGNEDLPEVPVVIRVPWKKGDATARIQAAIEFVAGLPLNTKGFRGAILLEKGIYEIQGALLINHSGIVLRGIGSQTILKGMGKDRTTLIQFEGSITPQLSIAQKIKDIYVPVNAQRLTVSDISAMHEGDLVQIQRPSTAAWITALGTDHFGGGITSLGWKPGQRDLIWYRKIIKLSGQQIYLDAPLTSSFDANFGEGTVAVVTQDDRIINCGIEQLQLQSNYDVANLKDESHRWMAITMNGVSDAWVRAVDFKYFAGSAVALYEHTSRITIQDCISLSPVSEIGGERRNTFFTEGQQNLFLRCFAEKGMHDFGTGFCAAGPNAFVQCTSSLPFDFSGGIDSWSTGVLFDIVNVDGQAISFKNRGQDGNGAGWNIANGMLWNCSAARIDCYKPPTAQNWSFGSWSQFSGDGYWAESNNSIQPRSFYFAQLKDRIGSEALNHRIQVMDIGTEASSSPSVEVAAALTAQSFQPAMTLPAFIETVRTKQFIAPTHAEAIKEPVQKSLQPEANTYAVQQGAIVHNGIAMVGGRQNEPWWNGSARRYALDKMQPALTRFVPGRKGTGLTDDLKLLTDTMEFRNKIVFDHNYGLWYERRRDDHERIRRIDGDVWAPFYELPFARSGKGAAWDGLSLYDLTRYNDWYWLRLRQFSDLAAQKGLLLFQQHYFQHNIIEAGAHYADFPWRTANNVNAVEFPEPVPYAGDKRIFMAAQFYDTTHVVRSKLHKAFIRKSLENFPEGAPVVHFIGEEFTGPLLFVQFWLNTIRSWSIEKHRHPMIGLSVTKDVQDAILSDPIYSKLIDVIDIKYWYYQANGEAYAPKGGQQLAPRQHARLLKPKSTSPEQVYRAVMEYRVKYPDKAVIYSADGYDRYGIPVLMAGGSLPNLKIVNKNLLSLFRGMKPVAQAVTDSWMLQDAQGNALVYDSKDVVRAHFPKGQYVASWIRLDQENEEVVMNTIDADRIEVTKPGASYFLLLKKIN